MEEGLRTLLAIGHTSPSFLLILMVFTSLWVSPLSAAYTALLLGLLVDLSKPILPANQMIDVALIGPACLGYLTGAYVTMQIRGMIFRHSPIAIGVMVFIAGAFAHLVTMSLLTARGLPWLVAEPIQGWNAADQLVARFLELVYTAMLAVPLGYILVRLQRLLGFPTHTGKTGPHPWRSRS